MRHENGLGLRPSCPMRSYIVRVMPDPLNDNPLDLIEAARVIWHQEAHAGLDLRSDLPAELTIAKPACPRRSGRGGRPASCGGADRDAASSASSAGAPPGRTASSYAS